MKKNYELLISIIVPHYESYNSLRKLLESIVSNIKEIPYEIIVVDDYSNDLEELNLIVSEFANKNIDLVFNKGKKSAGTCRNIGLKKALGKWILFADADDYFLPELNQHLNQYLKRKEDIIYFPPTSLNLENGGLSDRHIFYANLCSQFLEQKNHESQTRLRLLFLVPWSKMYRRSFIIENNIFFEEVKVSNDILFSAKAGLYSENILCTDRVIYCVTRQSNTLTSTVTKESTEIRFAEFVKYYQLLSNTISKEDLQSLNLSAKQFIKMSLNQKLDFKLTLSIFIKIFTNKIPLL